MDETDRRSWAEARLFALYEGSFAELEEEIRQLDPAYSPGDPRSIWPKKLTWEDFRGYLGRPVRNAEIRRCFLERLLLLATPQEEAALREALDPALLDSQDRARSDVEHGDSGGAPLRPPHFLSRKQQERSADRG